MNNTQRQKIADEIEDKIRDVFCQYHHLKYTDMAFITLFVTEKIFGLSVATYIIEEDFEKVIECFKDSLYAYAKSVKEKKSNENECLQ